MSLLSSLLAVIVVELLDDLEGSVFGRNTLSAS